MPRNTRQRYEQSIKELISNHDSGDTNTSNSKSLSVWEMAKNFISNEKNGHQHHTLIRNVDVKFEDPADGAREILERCGIISCPQIKHSVDSTDNTQRLPRLEETHLTQVLSYFQSIAAPPNNPNALCRARIVSTVGQIGTKCPRYHADHVPVRLVMSLVGPGCEYIPHELEFLKEAECLDGVNWQRIVDRNALNNLDEDDTAKANDIIVSPALLALATVQRGASVIKHAKEGEAVILMGKAWEDTRYATEKSLEGRDLVLAAVHRSPQLNPGQERMLLTVDLVDWDCS